VASWSDVGLAAAGGVIGVGGTLGATWLAHTLRRGDERAAERRAWVERGAAILGPLRSLLSDVEPRRIGMNLGPETRELMVSIRTERWEAALRDDLAAFATAHPAAEIRDRAEKLGVAVSNTLITTGWLVHDMLTGEGRSELDRAIEDHALAERYRLDLADALHEWGNTGATRPAETTRESSVESGAGS
jgi:hypothetical protein